MNSLYLKQKRILLVDDEQELLQLVVSILKEDGFLKIKQPKPSGKQLPYQKPVSRSSPSLMSCSLTAVVLT